jgi:hypothetical protein
MRPAADVWSAFAPEQAPKRPMVVLPFLSTAKTLIAVEPFDAVEEATEKMTEFDLPYVY